MTHQTAQASNELTQLLDTLVENCDKYLEMPQRDAELEQLRGRLRNERDRIRQTADADRSMIATVDGDIQAHLKAVESRLQYRGAELPSFEGTVVIPDVSIDAFKDIRTHVVKLRKQADGLLNEVDEILRFNATVRTIGYILLGIVFLLAVLVLTGVIPLYP